MPTDHAWQLTEIAGPDGTMATLATGTAPTLVLEDGNAAGNASCNTSPLSNPSMHGRSTARR